MVKPLRCLAYLLMLSHQHVFARPLLETNRQIAMNRAVKEIALAPDGRTVISAITDTTVAGGLPHLWILSNGSVPRQITGAGANRLADDSNPTWTGDGRKVLYLEKKGDVAVVHRIDVESGRNESLALSRQQTTVAGGWDAKPGGIPVVAKGFAPASSGAVAIWAADGTDERGKAFRKDDQHLFGQDVKVRLYLVDKDGEPREIAVPDDVRSVAWSKDGLRLLVITQSPSDDLGNPNHIWLIDKGKSREIPSTADNVQTISWLPDDRVIYIARCTRNAPTVCRDVFVQSLDGSKPRNLTEGIDGSVINGVDNFSTTGPIVTNSGDVLVTIARRFDQQVARIHIEDGRISWIGSLPPIVKALATNASQSGFAMMAAERGGVVSVQLADANLQSYSHLSSPELQPADWAPLRGRYLKWADDKLVIDGLLYVPPGTTKDKRVPLVIDVHGGPAGRFEDIDYPLVRLMLEKGWAVLHVNPRGSFGYGTAFLASLQDDLGGGDYRDIMTGIDAALAQAPLDRDRLALAGYSYGATMASFVLGRTSRFKALVGAAPVADQFSEYGTEDTSWYDRWYFGQPWRRFEAAWRQSPLSGVAEARTPFLMLQGESDRVNPPGQSIELYRALRQERSPVELILFPRESHHELGLNFYGFPSVEPWHGIVLRQRILNFLSAAFSGQPHAGLKIAD